MKGRTELVVPAANAFISYSHVNRKIGAEVQAALAQAGIPAFLAHDDLELSEEWQRRILEELRRCDIFIPLLSAEFMASKYAAQEVGFIIARQESGQEVAIVPVSVDGTKPFGFVSHLQSRPIANS